MKESATTSSYKEAYENVEKRIEKEIGVRHFQESGYQGFKVAKHRIQKKQATKKPPSNQLNLFK